MLVVLYLHPSGALQCLCPARRLKRVAAPEPRQVPAEMIWREHVEHGADRIRVPMPDRRDLLLEPVTRQDRVDVAHT